MAMKHISEIIKKRPPVKLATPRRKKNGKRGVTKRVVVVPEVEQYARTGGFKIPIEKKTKAQLKKGGRPPVVTQEIVGKLEVAFSYDATVEEACLDAGISPDAYYDFTKKYPAFSVRVEALRKAPLYVIRKKIVQTAQHDADLGMKYVERKNKMEFSTRTEVAHSGEVVNRHHVDPEQAALIKNAMGGFARKVAKLTAAEVAKK